MRNRKCYDAQLLLANLLSDFPGSHLVDEAQFMMGEAFQCQKDYVSAIFEYERLLNEYPLSPQSDAARFQIGECYYQEAQNIHHDQDETEKAIREFQRFVEDYPQSDLVPRAKDRILELRYRLASKQVMVADDYLTWGYYPSAQLIAEDVIQQFGDTRAVHEARLLIAEAKYKMGRLEEALGILTLLAGAEVDTKIQKQVVDIRSKVQEAMDKTNVAKE